MLEYMIKLLQFIDDVVDKVREKTADLSSHARLFMWFLISFASFFILGAITQLFPEDINGLLLLIAFVIVLVIMCAFVGMFVFPIMSIVALVKNAREEIERRKIRGELE